MLKSSLAPLSWRSMISPLGLLVTKPSTYQYESTIKDLSNKAVPRAVVLQSPPTSTTVWPGEFLELGLYDNIPTDSEYALELKMDAPSAQSAKISNIWPPPCVVSSVADSIRIPNLTDQPQTLKRNEHFCQVSPVFAPGDSKQTPTTPSPPLKSHTSPKPSTHSCGVSLAPASLFPPETVAKFREVNEQFDSVFNPQIEGYNGASGPFQDKVNMGPVEPPQRKGRLPQYPKDRLVELQQKFNELNISVPSNEPKTSESLLST